MELCEAVEKAGTDVTDWALQVTSAGSYEADAKKFSLISYDSAVKSMVIDFCTGLGARVRDEVWDQLDSEEGRNNPEAGYELLSDACTKQTLKAAFTFFAIGWVMGAPEHQLKPKNRETFWAVMRDTPPEQLACLEQQFSGEEYLRTRFTEQLEATKVVINKIFSSQRIALSPESVAQWCAITSTVPAFEAYELATRARMLIEEEVILEQMDLEFE